MRPHAKWLSTAVLAGLVVAPVFGQLPRVDVVALMQQPMDTPILLATPNVRKEIKLTDEQGQKFMAIAKEVQSKQPDIQKAIQETRDRTNKAIPDILSPEQAKRLQQIKLQVNGVSTFTTPEVQKKLKLTDKQKEEIQKIAANLNKDIRKTIEGAAGTVRDRLAAMAKVPQLKKDAGEKAVALLEDEQKKIWNEMVGDKFELKLEMMRPGARP
jgi:hypothetical protein